MRNGGLIVSSFFDSSGGSYASFYRATDAEELAFTDDFNRADEDLGASANWTFLQGTPTTALAIRSNQLSALTFSTQQLSYVCPDQGHVDQYVQFEVRKAATSGSFAVCRIADNSNLIGIRNGASGSIDVYKRVSNTFTLLTPNPNPQSVGIGDVIRLEVEGDNWRAYKNGALANSGSIGSTLTSTRQGVIARDSNSNPWMDNFEAGAL